MWLRLDTRQDLMQRDSQDWPVVVHSVSQDYLMVIWSLDLLRKPSPLPGTIGKDRSFDILSVDGGW